MLGPCQDTPQPRLAATPRDSSGPWTPSSSSLLQEMPAHTLCGGTADLWSTDRVSNSAFFFFFKCKAILEVLGVASYKLQQTLSSPDSFPLQKVMQTASREGEERSSSGDKTGTQGNAPVYIPSCRKVQHPAPWLQTPVVNSTLEHTSSCILPSPVHPIQSNGAGMQRAKHVGERERSMKGAWRATMLSRGTQEKLGWRRPEGNEDHLRRTLCRAQRWLCGARL